MPRRAGKKLLKMGDLIRKTGVQRQTIHFYINKGLLPRPLKTGRNMAYYDESYVDRIKLIKELQLKRFLPLDVIKQIMAQTDGKLSSSEIDVIRVSGEGLIQLEELKREYEPQTLSELSERTGLPPEEIQEMERCEMIRSTKDDRGEVLYGDHDIRIVEAFSQIRKGGLTREAGFEVEDLRLQSDIINMLAIEEVKLFARKFSQRFQEDAPELLPKIGENAINSVNNFIAHLRRRKILDAIEAFVEERQSEPVEEEDAE